MREKKERVKERLREGGLRKIETEKQIDRQREGGRMKER